MRFSNLNDWLLWQQNSHPLAIDLGLERVAQVAANLDLLRPKARVVTVAGTNGKGSCVAALEALLLSAGNRCGAYTSPHLLRYNERVRIDRDEVTDADLCAAFEVIDQARGDISLTYFEFGTLAALYLFNREPLDYWLLEVGLGGRLDATNIIDADIAIVTSIDIDHIDWLGDNREDIGREKAGIFRAQSPAVCADAQPPKSLLKHAQTLGCPLALLNKEFGFRAENEGVVFWSGAEQTLPIAVNLPLPSLAAAFHAAYLLGLPQPSALAATFADLTLAGRMQRERIGHQMMLLDVAHNPAAARQLANNLAKEIKGQRLAVVVAMMADKDTAGTLAPLSPMVYEWAVCTIHDLPRAATAEALMTALPDVNKHIHASVADALQALAAREDIQFILVTGSFYTVAEAQSWLIHNRKGHEATG